MFEDLIYSEDDNPDLQIDLDKAISFLKPKQAFICNQLKEKSIAEIAKNNNLSRGSINNAIKNLKEIAKKLGLEIYL